MAAPFFFHFNPNDFVVQRPGAKSPQGKRKGAGSVPVQPPFLAPARKIAVPRIPEPETFLKRVMTGQRPATRPPQGYQARPLVGIPTQPGGTGTAKPRPGGFPPNPRPVTPTLNPKGASVVVYDPKGKLKSTSRPTPRDTLTIRTNLKGEPKLSGPKQGMRVKLTGSPILTNSQRQVPTPGFFGAVKSFLKSVVTKDPIGIAAFGQLAFGLYSRDVEAASLKGQPADPAILDYIIQQLKQDGLTLNARGAIVPDFQVPGPARDC